MNSKFQNLAQSLSEKDTPVDLADKIIIKISQEKLRILQIKATISAVGFFISGIVLVWAGQMAAQEIASSGLAQFLSLLGTDFVAMAIYWDEFVMTLLETLPIVSLVICLAGILGVLASWRYFVQETSLMKNLNYKKYGY